MKKTILSVLFLGLALLCVSQLSAQPGPGPLTGPPTPIDGGLSALLAAGAALGYKKYKGKSSKGTN